MARRKQITTTTVIVVAGIALTIGFITGRATSPRKGAAEPVTVAAASSGKYVEKKLDLDPSPYKGTHDAPIVIHEVSDFQ